MVANANTTQSGDITRLWCKLVLPMIRTSSPYRTYLPRAGYPILVWVTLFPNPCEQTPRTPQDKSPVEAPVPPAPAPTTNTAPERLDPEPSREEEVAVTPEDETVGETTAGSSLFPPVTGPPLGPTVDQVPLLPRLPKPNCNPSLSVGSPTKGELQCGVPLPPSAPGLRSNPIRPNPRAGYGTAHLVRALLHAAKTVAEIYPNSTLWVHDISHRRGGWISHHRSHRAGRDVDVMFYLLDDHGHPRQSKAIPIGPDGRGTDYGDLLDPTDDIPVQFDVPRTWAFLQALAQDPRTWIHRVFIAEHIRTQLLEHAAAVQAPQRAVDQIAHVTCQPANPHDDHMHIRFYCSPEDIDAGCLDTWPVYPWHQRRLARLGKTSNPAPAPRPRPARPKRAFNPQDLPPMHESVREFLEQRHQWASKPHPGRRYCP